VSLLAPLSGGGEFNAKTPRQSKARQGWHICSLTISQPTELRQEWDIPDVAPTELVIFCVRGSTNMSRRWRCETAEKSGCWFWFIEQGI
jgi:hypothetical protein